MSWSRILRFAKQRQVPVIITDESGEEPMILLSLDALEQALDGGVGPELPTPAPAPRSTTPSFVPEPEYVEAPPVSETVAQIEDVLPEAEPTESKPEPDADPLQEPKVAVEPVVINDFETPEPAKPATSSETRLSEVEIMTPPDAVQSPVEAPEPAKPKEISLEERFFLDF